MRKSLNDIYNGLKSLGLPVTHIEWEVGHVPELPYIIYREDSKSSFHADNKPYYLTKTITVELYSDYKDEKTEALLESFFYAQNITLSNVEENFWAEEHLYEVSYEFEI